MRSDSLAYLWGGLRGKRIRRALFFTYRFNFRWFHDQVLSKLRHGPWKETEISVIASRFGDETANGTGDLYSLGEWASLPRLKIRYLPPAPVYHAKFILAELKGGALVVGGGSANLTGSGWTQQAELWSWKGRSALQCHAFLKDTASKVGPGLLEEWIARTGTKSTGPELPWLIDDKAAARRRAFKYLLDPNNIGSPKRLVIASPYFDADSAIVFEELFASVPAAARGSVAIEIWTDASRLVSRRSDYEQLVQLVQRYKVLVRAPFLQAVNKHDTFPHPLHLKAIEASGTKGRRIIFGSANFTGAAWIGSNRETLFGESNGSPLQELLAGYDLRPQSVARLRALAAWGSPDEDDLRERNLIYWAVYDEQERRLIVSFRSAYKVIRVRIEASVDKRRLGEERVRLEQIAKDFSTPTNWCPPAFTSNLITINQRNALQIPERLGVALQLSNGRTIRCGVEVNAPDFGERGTRDRQTGMPWDLSDALAGIVGIPRLIAQPLPKQTTFEASGDADVGDEEELEPTPRLTLATDPEYHLEPEAVRLARRIARASHAERAVLREAINRRLPFLKEQSQRLLIEASLKALDK